MNADEKFVRKHVERIFGPLYDEGPIRLVDLRVNGFPDWSAAAEFTRTCLAEIADVEEEVAWVKNELSIERYCDLELLERIMTREQAALAELKRRIQSQRKAETSAKEK